MNQNTLRIGNFTSSEIYKLMSKSKDGKSFGKPALTYIAEKNFERKLGRSLSNDVTSRPTSWGKIVELQAFNLLGIEYKISSTETIGHKTIQFWSGSPDCEKFDDGKTVVDIKCPMTLKSFCELVDIINIGKGALEDERPEYFWQLVSNAILTDSKYAELIVYVPYKAELDAIRELASNFDGNQNKIAWINWAEDDDLPYLIEGKHYKNLYTLRFEVTSSDRLALTEAVMKAGQMLEGAVPKPYAPTDEQKQKAQEKIKMMKDLQKKLRSKLEAKYDASTI